MPRVETNYYCDVCGKKFGSEDKAVQCETKHVTVVKVKKTVYDATSDNKSKYPLEIVVSMSDGKNIQYYRK